MAVHGREHRRRAEPPAEVVLLAARLFLAPQPPPLGDLRTLVDGGEIANHRWVRPAEALAEFRAFNYDHIYMRPASLAQSDSVIRLLRALVEYHAESMPVSDAGFPVTRVQWLTAVRVGLAIRSRRTENPRSASPDRPSGSAARRMRAGD